MEIEINSDFKEAADLISLTNDCIFVNGNAGCGKTTFLQYYLTIAKKKTVVLAPTGVAALNAGGQTIHSFFKFKPDISLSKIKKKTLKDNSIYKKVETIIIDEVSMLRCDLLDCIDKFLCLNRGVRSLPFGGVQMVFIGDLKQLPPVVKREEADIFRSVYASPFFLSAKSLNNCMLHTIELKKNYRQQDENFINLLNLIRDGKVSGQDLALLNSRVLKTLPSLNGGKTVYLAITNAKSDRINFQYLSKIQEKSFDFFAQTENVDANSNVFPAQAHLVLKKGAQVMLLNNDAQDRWVNGSIGTVDDIRPDIDSETMLVYVKFPNGRVESVGQYKWELFKYKWNERMQQIETESAGSFTQYPLKLAWAVTVHKSQGKTFDNIIVDMEFGAFAPGQLYVALSRCTSLEGISLTRPIRMADILKTFSD